MRSRLSAAIALVVIFVLIAAPVYAALQQAGVPNLSVNAASQVVSVGFIAQSLCIENDSGSPTNVHYLLSSAASGTLTATTSNPRLKPGQSACFPFAIQRFAIIGSGAGPATVNWVAFAQ